MQYLYIKLKTGVQTISATYPVRGYEYYPKIPGKMIFPQVLKIV